MSSDLERVRATWDALASSDDLYGVIWGDSRRREFFATGEREIARTLRRGRPRRRESALDFGCGVGRLTQAMASRFTRVVGVDVSERMIDAARTLNRHDNVKYVVNAEATLPFADETFDFVYSMVVFQHMPPALGVGYIAELARVLRADGLLVFQVPDRRAPLPRLPRSAVLAVIEASVDSLQLPPGARMTINVRTRNESRQVWPGTSGERMIYLGNHWLAESGDVLVQDDGRVGLGRDVAPDEEIDLALEVTAPAVPGRYSLELDLVQQEVGWFSHRRKLSRRRTQSVRIPVEVGDFPAPPPRAAVEAEPQMEMHAIPRDEVLAALGSARVLRIEEDRAAGLGWHSARYWATK